MELACYVQHCSRMGASTDIYVTMGLLTNEKIQEFRGTEDETRKPKILDEVSEKQNEDESIFEEIMAQIFPEMIKHRFIEETASENMFI